jgi:hypothetical protein
MKYTWLIHGGDRNSWIWPHWKIWQDKNCKIPDGLDVTFLTEEKPIPKSWQPIKSFVTGKKEFSEQLSIYLNSCKSEYILYSMDDFFLTGQPDFQAIEDIATVMKINDLPNVKIHTTKYTENKKELYTRFAYNLLVYAPWRQYSASCQVSLWNRLFLLSILNIKENGWAFEIKGSERITAQKIDTYLYDGPCIYPYKEVIKRGRIRSDSHSYFDKDKK